TEEVADVCVEHVVASASAFAPQHLQRVGRRTAGPKPKRAVSKADLKDRLQDQLRRRLYDSIAHRRDPKWPLFSISLRDVPPQDRLRSVRIPAQYVAKLFEEEFHAVMLDFRDRLGIDARGPLIPSHLIPRLLEDVSPRDSVIQRVKLSTRLLLGHIPQSILQTSHVVAGTTPVGEV